MNNELRTLNALRKFVDKTFVFFVLVLIICPIRGQSHAHKAETIGKSESPAPTAPPATEQQAHGDELQTEGERHVRADVTALSTPKESAFDDPAFWVQVVLAGVGIVGIGVGLRTLGKIKTQTEEMTLQRRTMQDTLAAISRQADLMDSQLIEMKAANESSGLAASETLAAIKRQADALDKQNLAIRNRERARLTVTFPPKDDPDFVTPWKIETDEGLEMMFSFAVEMHNRGISKAFSVRAEMNFQVREKESPFVHDFFMSVSVPNVIGDVGEDCPVPIMLETLIPVRDIDRVQDGSAELYVYGQVTYRDVFDDLRVVPFRYVWSLEYWGEADETQQFTGGWENRTPAKSKLQLAK